MPPGGFHMEVDMSDIDGDKEAVKDRRASAFEIAFRHAAEDSAFRLQMIFGETYRAYQDVLFELTRKLAKESAVTRDLARRCLADPSIIHSWVRDAEVADMQQMLLAEAYPEADKLTESEEQKCLPTPE